LAPQQLYKYKARPAALIGRKGLRGHRPVGRVDFQTFIPKT